MPNIETELLTRDGTVVLQDLINARLNAFAVELVTESYRLLVKNTGETHILRFAYDGVAFTLQPFVAGEQDAIEGNEAKPLDMLIFCPNCKMQHVDKPEPNICRCGHHRKHHHSGHLKECQAPGDSKLTNESYRGALICRCLGFKIAWNNPPHKSHSCRKEDGGCGHIFRIADFPTNGVEAIKTGGKDGTWPKTIEGK